MLLAALRIDVRIPACRSLKEKRHVMKALTNGIRSFEVAVAETGYHDKWQRAELGVAAVGTEGYHLRKVMHSVERFVERFAEVDLIDTELTMHAPED
ncbi:MAG TPA: DUF503 domain-containing protein [Actinomycetota bacterium]|nr:DUF503 domain-containing protein [Actinomycetota bacterium]